MVNIIFILVFCNLLLNRYTIAFSFFPYNTADKKPEEKSDASEEKGIEGAEKKDESAKDSDARSTKSTSKKPESDRGKRSSDKRVRSWEHHRSHTRSRSRERRRRDDVLTFAKIRVSLKIITRVYFALVPNMPKNDMRLILKEKKKNSLNTMW